MADGTYPEFASAFQSASIGLALIGFGGEFLRVNDPLCALLGRSRDELLAMTWQDVTYSEDVAKGVMRSDLMRVGDEEAFQLEKRYVRPDGELVWAMLNVSLIRDSAGRPECMFTQVVDMTQYRQTEAMRNRLGAIAEASDDAIIGTSPDGTVLAWNRGAERMFGYPAESVMGQPVTLIVPEDGKAELRHQLAVGQEAGEVLRSQMVCVAAQGSRIEVLAAVSPVRRTDGALDGVALIIRNITEQRRLARALDASLGELEDALDQARESEALSRRFLADAAHQLRTPIAGIRACAETLLRGVGDDERDHVLLHLLRETSRANRLQNSLLRMARLDQGERLTFKPSPLSEICADEAERARALAPELDISLDTGPMTDWRPSVDAHAVREILANLLDNARRHARRKIEMVVSGSGGAVRIEVFDDGPGLPDAMVDRAFERFVSFDGQGGSGLGLPIARELARAHAGDLTYEGGRFVIRLESARQPKA